jgi:uroporphyrinogen-III synthase
LTLPLLITRPEPGASATAERARALGLTVILAPLFELQARAWMPPAPDGFDAVLITSANAIRMGGAALQTYHHLPLLAVGEATAAVAREAGFTNVTASEGDGLALIALAAQAGHRRLLHLCGHEHRSLPYPNGQIIAVPVYAAETISPPPVLPSGAPYVAMAYSGRAAARLAEIIGDRSLIHIVAISQTAADAAGDGWGSVQFAPAPGDAAMLALAARICEQQA